MYLTMHIFNYRDIYAELYIGLYFDNSISYFGI